MPQKTNQRGGEKAVDLEEFARLQAKGAKSRDKKRQENVARQRKSQLKHQQRLERHMARRRGEEQAA